MLESETVECTCSHEAVESVAQLAPKQREADAQAPEVAAAMRADEVVRIGTEIAAERGTQI